MRIDINANYAITSDADQFIINKKSICKSDRKGVQLKDEFREGAKAGDELLTAIGYVSTVEQCYRYLLQRQIRESDAVGFSAVLTEVKRIERELKASIKF